MPQKREQVCTKFRQYTQAYLQSADEYDKAGVRLKGSHVQVGDEVHHAHCSRHKGNLVLFIPQELDHL